MLEKIIILSCVFTILFVLIYGTINTISNKIYNNNAKVELVKESNESL